MATTVWLALTLWLVMMIGSCHPVGETSRASCLCLSRIKVLQLYCTIGTFVNSFSERPLWHPIAACAYAVLAALS